MSRVCLVAFLLSVSSAAIAEEPFMEQQVLFRAGEDGYGGYRIPCVLVTSKPGTVLVFAEARQALDGFGVPFPDHAVTEIVMRRSTDHGRTWSRQRVIVESGGATTGNPCAAFERGTCTVVLVFCRGTKPAEKGAINKFVHVIKSSDHGLTWSKPVEITNAAKGKDWKYVFTGPGSGIQLRSGRLLIPCTGEHGPQFSYMLYSDDHGATWKRTGPLRGEDTLDPSTKWHKLGKKPLYYSPDNVTDEPGVVELADGRVYFNARSRLEVGHRGYAYSSDGGLTWSKIRFHPQLPESVVDGGIGRLADENVLLVSRPTFRYKNGMPYGGMWSHRRNLTISISSDDGRTWPASRMIHEGPAAYSDLTTLPGGEILCLFEGGKKFRYETLTLARFNLAWIKGGEAPDTDATDSAP